MTELRDDYTPEDFEYVWDRIQTLHAYSQYLRVFFPVSPETLGQIPYDERSELADTIRAAETLFTQLRDRLDLRPADWDVEPPADNGLVFLKRYFTKFPGEENS